MKKLLCIILAVCTLLLLMTSCADKYPLPDSSKNFSKEFIENFSKDYYLADHDLMYLSASMWEAETPNGYKLAKIDGVEDNMFVSATFLHKTNLSSDVCLTHVFQHKDAPSPMKDWTIENIYFLRGEDREYFCLWYPNEDSSGSIDGTSVRTPLAGGFPPKEDDAFFSFNCETDGDIIDDFKATYQATKENSNFFSTGFFIVITFKENKNIVWLSEVGYNHSSPFLSLKKCYHTDLYPPSADFSYVYLNYDTSKIIKQKIMELYNPSEAKFSIFDDFEMYVTKDNIPIRVLTTKGDEPRMLIIKNDPQTGKDIWFYSDYNPTPCEAPEGGGNYEVTEISYDKYLIKWKTDKGWYKTEIFASEILKAYQERVGS